MSRVVFTQNLKRHIECPEVTVEGGTVRDVLNAVFCNHERLRGYVLDEQGKLRTHMVVFVDGTPVKDRINLSDRVKSESEIFVMQALSGG